MANEEGNKGNGDDGSAAGKGTSGEDETAGGKETGGESGSDQQSTAIKIWKGKTLDLRQETANDFEAEIDEPMSIYMMKSRVKIAAGMLIGLGALLLVHYFRQYTIQPVYQCDLIINKVAAAPREELESYKTIFEHCLQANREGQAALEKILTTWFTAVVALTGAAIGYFFNNKDS